MTIDFGRAFSDLFATERKWMTVLGLSVCMLIPIAGQMVMIGYLVRRFAREREGHPPEDFNFDFFAEYLKIGLWPTLAMLVVAFAMSPVFVILMLPVMFLVVLFENNPELAVVFFIACGVFSVGIIAVVTACLYPIALRSALMMDFKAGFSWPFIKSFIGKVGLSLAGYALLIMLMSFPLMIVGYLALFVGIYVVAAWLQFASYHMVFQHYDDYLERGGERIEVNPEVTKDFATASFPPSPPPPPQTPPAPPEKLPE